MANDQGGGCGTILLIILVGFGVYKCSSSSNITSGGASAAADSPAVEDRVADRAADIRAGSYEDTYGDTACTSDCSGHDAGFEWAKDNDIDDESDCDGRTGADSSFAEGCRAFVNAEETAGEEDDDSDGEKGDDDQ